MPLYALNSKPNVYLFTDDRYAGIMFFAFLLSKKIYENITDIFLNDLHQVVLSGCSSRLLYCIKNVFNYLHLSEIKFIRKAIVSNITRYPL